MLRCRERRLRTASGDVRACVRVREGFCVRPARCEWTVICPVLLTPGRYIITAFSPTRASLSGFPAGCAGRAGGDAASAVERGRRERCGHGGQRL